MKTYSNWANELQSKIERLGETPKEQYENLTEMLSHRKYIVRDKETGKIYYICSTLKSAKEELVDFEEPALVEIVEIWK